MKLTKAQITTLLQRIQHHNAQKKPDRHDVECLRQMVSLSIKQLQHDLEKMSQHNDAETPPSLSSTHLWGEKENVISLLTKLTGLLTKLMPLTPDAQGKEMISPEEDREIIQRYLKRYKQRISE